MNYINKAWICEKIQSREIKENYLAFFYTQLGMGLETGIAILQVLEMIKTSTTHRVLKKLIEDLKNEVEKGAILSEAMATRSCFETFDKGIVASGEVSGKLDRLLAELGDYYTRKQEVRRKFKKALAYPTFIAVMILMVSIAMMQIVIPSFANLFEDMDVKLPFLTQFIIIMSKGISRFRGVILVGILMSLLGIVSIFKINKIKIFREQMLLHFPGIGQIVELRMQANFCNTFGILLNAGIPILQALEIVNKVIDYESSRKEIGNAINLLNEGETFIESFATSKIYGKLIKNMIGIGEITGRLDELFLRLGQYYTKQVENVIESKLVFVEPLLTIVMAIVIGVMMGAVMFPIFTLTSQMKW